MEKGLSFSSCMATSTSRNLTNFWHTLYLPFHRVFTNKDGRKCVSHLRIFAFQKCSHKCGYDSNLMYGVFRPTIIHKRSMSSIFHGTTNFFLNELHKFIHYLFDGFGTNPDIQKNLPITAVDDNIWRKALKHGEDVWVCSRVRVRLHSLTWSHSHIYENIFGTQRFEDEIRAANGYSAPLCCSDGVKWYTKSLQI
jgi:hypothetical protein